MPTRIGRLMAIGALLLVLVLTGCSSADDSATGAGDSDTGPATTESPDADPAPTSASGDPDSSTSDSAPSSSASTEGSTTDTTLRSPAPSGGWEVHDTDGDCQCADGSEFVYFSETLDPEKVMLYFQGGGACFNEMMCQFSGGSYFSSTSRDNTPANTGIFDRSNPANPLADYSVVFVPYCTGDVHLGDATAEYGELTVEHRGYANARHAADHVIENFPDASEVLVTGSSAGGVPAPLFGGILADEFPDADVAVLADASGGYPSNPGVNGFIGGLWGTEENIPDWPETQGLDSATWGIPDLFVHAGNHAPQVRMARYDNAWDSVQVQFSALAGVGAEGLPAVLDENEDLAEDAGVDLDVYIAPGDDHTILGSPGMYDLEVEGVGFLDWLTTFVEGGSPGDVRCVECEQP